MVTLLRLTLFATTLSACATRAVVPPPVPSAIPARPDTTRDPGVAALRFSSGVTRYNFTQTADIRSEVPGDTGHSTIKTDAVLTVEITTSADSTYDILVSADSLTMLATGAIPSRSYSLPLSLGPIARFRAGNLRTTVEVLLPDSLCAHGQLIATARELILPALPGEFIPQRNKKWVDSLQFLTCPAGSTLETTAVREIQDLGTQPAQFTMRSTSTLSGRGILRTDSVMVSGSVTGEGRALMNEGARLPTFVESRAEGTITVQLGDSNTVFRQVSTQQIRQRMPN